MPIGCAVVIAIGGARLAGGAGTAGGAGSAGSAGSAGKTATPPGSALYDRLCLPCHGTNGDGQGPAAPWLWPRPRNFTSGDYKWRTTRFGSPPTDADLSTTIKYGVPGTSMHAFGHLSPAQISDLVTLLKQFAPARFSKPAVPIAIEPTPPIDTALIAQGKQTFSRVGCPQCHGATLAGDGVAAKHLRNGAGAPAGPYDLTGHGLRRPRPHAGTSRDDGPRAIYTSITTGLAGTPMASFEALPSSARWALAAYIDSVRSKTGQRRGRDRTSMHPIAIDLDRKNKLTKAGYWPGNGTRDEQALFGKTIQFQGTPPAALAPAQASLDANQCARCHAKQQREWKGSLHGSAASPGLLAQLIQQPTSAGGFVESCQRCHAPLAEQARLVRPGHTSGNDTNQTYTRSKAFAPQLRAQGISCAGCHVRGWKRFGPPSRPGSTLLSQPGYPVTELPIYERSDFCLGCHQLPVRLSVAGKPLLNTYREWLEGPYMPRGIQCQHCHMPNREHTWKGVHDKATFRQAITLSTGAKRWPKTGVVSVRARLVNVGAGHYLPTTPTPAAWIEVELLDRSGRAIHGARSVKRIGRKIRYTGGAWTELEDTRVPPGEAIELSAAWKRGKVANATHARIIVRVEPDDYYAFFYRTKLKGTLSRESRRLFQKALRAAEASGYIALQRLVPVR